VRYATADRVADERVRQTGHVRPTGPVRLERPGERLYVCHRLSFRANETRGFSRVLCDLGFFGAMAPCAAGGGNELDPRFLSLCTVFSLPGPADDTIRHIFGSVLSGHTTRFTDDIRSSARGVVDATVRLYRVRARASGVRNARRSTDGPRRFSAGARQTAPDAGKVRVRFQFVSCRSRRQRDDARIARHVYDREIVRPGLEERIHQNDMRPTGPPTSTYIVSTGRRSREIRANGRISVERKI